MLRTGLRWQILTGNDGPSDREHDLPSIESALKIPDIGLAKRSVETQLDGRSLHQRSARHHDVRIVPLHRPRFRNRIGVKNRAFLHGPGKRHESILGPALYTQNDVTALLAGMGVYGKPMFLKQRAGQEVSDQHLLEHKRGKEETAQECLGKPEVRSDFRTNARP